MAQTIQRKRIIGNPGKRVSSKSHSKKRSNPGEILGFTLANPGRKVAHKVKKTAKRKTATAGTKVAKRNPGRLGGSRSKTHRKAKRHNVGGMGSGGLGGLVTNGVFAIVGALGSKLGAQAILGAKNTGVMGYAANAGVGAGLAFLAEKGLRNRPAAMGILTGTVIQILLRAINDYTPFGQYVASLGMGDYQMQSFVTPQILVSPNESAALSIPGGWAPTTVIAPSPAATMAAGAGMSGLYSRSGSRNNIYSV